VELYLQIVPIAMIIAGGFMSVKELRDRNYGALVFYLCVGIMGVLIGMNMGK